MRHRRQFSVVLLLLISLLLAACGGGGGYGGGNRAPATEPFSLTGAALTFAGDQGTSSAQLTGGGPLTVRGSNVSWQATTTVPWIQLSALAGTTAGPIPFTVSPAALNVGTWSGVIRVTDSISGRTEEATVALTVRAFGVIVTPEVLTFNVDATTTSVTQTLTIADANSGQNPQAAYSWNLASRSPLVQLLPTSGTTSPTAQVTVSLNVPRLNAVLLDEGSTKLDLTASRPGLSVTRTIDVNVNVRLPRAHAVEPNIVVPGPARVTLIGRDFQPEDVARLRVNGQAPANVVRLSDRELDVDLGPLGAGGHLFTFTNGLGMARSASSLAVTPRGIFGAGEIVSPGPRQRLLFESHRGVLFAVNNKGDSIQQFSWSGSAWQELPTIALVDVQDADFASNVLSLYAISPTTFFYVSSTQVPNPTATSFLPTGLNCGSALTHLENVTAPNTGTLHAFIPGLCRFAGTTQTVSGGLQFELLGGALLLEPFPATNETTFLTGRRSRVSGDRRWVATTKELWDSRTGTFAYTEIQGSPVFSDSAAGPDISLDRQGTKVLLGDTFVVNRAGTVLCTLPVSNVAVLSSDGTRAYAYTHVNGGGGEIRRFNAVASGAPGSPAQCPTAGAAIAVPQDMGTPGIDTLHPLRNPHRQFAMTMAADDSILFLSGPARILAIQPP